jgi:hypothetical protein
MRTLTTSPFLRRGNSEEGEIKEVTQATGRFLMMPGFVWISSGDPTGD